MLRVGGLASGMDIEAIVKNLMSAERMPLDRMQQDRTLLEWKRDAFRETNLLLSEFDKMMLDMKLSTTYTPKKVSSSQEGSVTATASTSTPDGAYKIEVKKLATSAINVSTEAIAKADFNPSKPLGEQQHLFDEENGIEFGTFQFSTFDDNGDAKPYEFTVSENDSLNDVLKRITNADNNVRAFYDEQSGKVVLETTRTGKYNQSGENEIVFVDNTFFTNVLKLNGNEQGGENAEFTYNGALTVESKNNSYTLNGITFEFKDVTNGPATININHDIDASFNAIMKFIDKYNEIVDKLNGSQREEKFRDYKPLTDEQKKEMSEDEIKLWEERAKSAILRGESVISNSLFAMRSSWYATVETGGDIKSLTQIGIKTSSAYMDGGKLIVDEKALKEALREDPEGVRKLFSNSETGASRGLVNRLEDAVEATVKGIEERAGKSTSTLENYTLGKRMKDLNERISGFESRLLQIESRYWSQFTAMEKAISRMNQQSSYLMSQFGGGM